MYCAAASDSVLLCHVIEIIKNLFKSAISVYIHIFNIAMHPML